MMKRILFPLLLPLALSACGTDTFTPYHEVFHIQVEGLRVETGLLNSKRFVVRTSGGNLSVDREGHDLLSVALRRDAAAGNVEVSGTPDDLLVIRARAPLVTCVRTRDVSSDTSAVVLWTCPPVQEIQPVTQSGAILKSPQGEFPLTDGQEADAARQVKAGGPVCVMPDPYRKGRFLLTALPCDVLRAAGRLTRPPEPGQATHE